MIDEQRYFREFVRLMGKQIEVGALSTGRKIQGRVVNAMFDSFLLETANGREVIRFDDISYLNEIPTPRKAA